MVKDTFSTCYPLLLQAFIIPSDDNNMTMSGTSPTNTDSTASSSFSGSNASRTKCMRAMAATQIRRRITNPYKNHPHIKGLKYVIFPNNPKILCWDFLMILVVFYYAFWIPYHFGIAGGYILVTKNGFFSYQMCLDALFVSEFSCYYRRRRQIPCYSLTCVVCS